MNSARSLHPIKPDRPRSDDIASAEASLPFIDRDRLRRASALTLVLRLIVFTLVWWLLSRGAADAWLFGVPVIVLATGLSLLIQPATPWSVWGLLKFLPYFLYMSLSGATDVAARAVRPQLHIEPNVLEIELTLPRGSPQLFMTFVLSLLPSTLSVELENDVLLAHVLDERISSAASIYALERRVAAIFPAAS